MTRELTPYDTGIRLEPQPWVKPSGSGWISGKENLRPSEPDDFGRVDFDDDSGCTIVTAYIERRDGDVLVMHVYSHDSGIEAQVVMTPDGVSFDG